MQTESNLGQPVVVFTGPPKGQGQGATQVASVAAKPVKPAAAASVAPWTSLSPAALAASPPSELRATPVRAGAVVPLPRARPRMAVEKPDQPQIR